MIFADDKNMFYSSKDPEQLQSVIDEELRKVLKYCAANMLSINFKKTNYMIITSLKKRTNISLQYRTKISDKIFGGFY